MVEEFGNAFKKAEIGCLEVDHRTLRWSCVKLPEFETTADLPPIDMDILVGQSRAEMALKIGVETPGHIYTNSPLNSALVNFIRKIASQVEWPAPMDILRVYNFRNPDRPCFIKISKGEGVLFKERIERKLLMALKECVRVILNKDADNKQRQDIYDNSVREANKLCGQVTVQSEEFGTISFFSTVAQGGGVVVFPQIETEINGVPQKVTMNRDEYSRLSDEELEKYHNAQSELMGRVREVMIKGEELFKAIVEKNKEAVGLLFEEEVSDLRVCYEKNPKILEFLDGLKQYTLNHLDVFSLEEQYTPFMMPAVRIDPFLLLPFHINVSVDNSGTEGVPIIVEGNPTNSRLFGQIIRKGGVFAPAADDHTMIREGALAKACGGVLILPVAELFKNDTLDRLFAVLSRERLDVGEIPDLLSTFGSNIKPEPLELDTKVILVGEMIFFHILSHHYVFSKNTKDLIRRVAEFDVDIDQDEESVNQMLRLLSHFSLSETCLPLDRDAAMKMLQFSARSAGNKNRFSLDMKELKEILVDATYWARKSKAGCEIVTGEDVKKALESKIFTLSRIRDRMYRAIREGIFITDVAGSKVGEVNALTVYYMDQLMFAMPTKVTVQIFAGRGGVMSVEEKVGQAGPNHRKSFDILEAFFRSRYGKTSLLSFGASVCFEQSYGESDGDSATLAEFCGVISALSGLPIRQDVAITGSMNQMGVVQPIGGENWKVEGFFDACVIKGAKDSKNIDWRKALTGTQGVIVPKLNLDGLVLRDDVMDAIEEGKFHIYAVSHVDEAMEILTGVKAGEVMEDNFGTAMEILNKVRSEVPHSENIDEAVKILTEKILPEARSGQPNQERGHGGRPIYPKGTINYLVLEGLKKINAFGNETKKNN